MAATIHVCRNLPARLLELALREPRIECCGLLAGIGGAIAQILPARNALRSATAYEIEPLELFRLFRRMRESGLDLLGIYHSHPATENAPSPRDIELAYYPDAAYLILSPRAASTRPVRAFRIRQGVVEELEIVEDVDPLQPEAQGRGCPNPEP